MTLRSSRPRAMRISRLIVKQKDCPVPFRLIKFRVSRRFAKRQKPLAEIGGPVHQPVHLQKMFPGRRNEGVPSSSEDHCGNLRRRRATDEGSAHLLRDRTAPMLPTIHLG